jgi:hypothetical protein
MTEHRSAMTRRRSDAFRLLEECDVAPTEMSSFAKRAGEIIALSTRHNADAVSRKAQRRWPRAQDNGERSIRPLRRER